MYEIELKAHVSDCDAVRKKLDEFAKYGGRTEKKDVYYSTENPRHIAVRIREEKDGHGSRFLLTYKRKQMIVSAIGKKTEVNDENECVISSPATLEKVLFDAGFKVFLKKQKIVENWHADTNAGQAHIELCDVQPLGFFLELEIMSENDDSDTVQATQETLYDILEKCGVDKSQIEHRYYSDMLREMIQSVGIDSTPTDL